MWYLYALLGPAIWAFLNHFDKYLLARFFTAGAPGPVLVVFTGIAAIVVAITILLMGAPVSSLAPGRALLAMGAGLLLVASYIPYMIALARQEASIVASLYRLAPIFVFALSYVVLGERLEPQQIVGGLITIAGSILLVIDPDRSNGRLDFPTFSLMCIACVMNACTAVLFKLVALETSFWSSAFWQYVGAGLFSVLLITGVSSYRRALLVMLRSRDIHLLVSATLSAEVFNLLANLAVSFAALMAPLALVSAVTGLHPLFLLAYGTVFTLFLPTFGQERLAAKHLALKAAAVGIMCLGIVITFVV